MREVQASQAKIHLLRLLDDVERGETLVITRHGRRIARLEPDQDHQKEQAKAAVREILELRKTAPSATLEEILSWKREGQK